MSKQGSYRKITIPTTDLSAICTGDKFNNFSKVMCKIWSKYHPISYYHYKSIFDSSGEYVANDSMYKKMAILSKKISGNVNVIDEIKDINKSRNTTQQLVTKQDELLKKLDAEIENKKAKVSTVAELAEIEKEKSELYKLVKSSTNVVYGTRNECSGYEYFEANTNIKVVKKQMSLSVCFKTDDLPNDILIDWFITGKGDGLTNTDEIIEIKNRRNKLYNHVYDGEMCQIQTYMNLFNKPNTYLVEIITQNGKTNGNILKVERQYDYMDINIKPKLNKITEFMRIMFYDEDDTTFTENEKESICMELLRGDEERRIYNMLLSE